MARESTIQIYNSVAGTTSPSDLAQGEMAFAGGNDSLFIGKNGGATAWIGAAILNDDTFATASDTTLATSDSIKAYVDGQLGASAGVTQIEGLTGAVDVATVNGVTHSASSSTLTIQGITATSAAAAGSATRGVASFNSTYLDVSDGFVTPKGITISSGSGTDSDVQLGETLRITADHGVQTIVSSKIPGTAQFIVRGITATTSTPGVASFNSNQFNLTDAQVNANSITLYDDDGDQINFTLGNALVVTGDNGIQTNLITKGGFSAAINIRGINASDTQKGVASFSADDFDVVAGAVSLEDTVLKGLTVGGANVTPSTHRIEVGGGTAAVFNTSAAGFTIGIQQATTSQLGVAKFNSGDFAVDAAGEVTFVGSAGVSSVTGVTASGIRTDPTSGDVIIYGVTASTGGQLGVAAFSSTNFSINPAAGIVTIKDGGVANAELVNSSVSVSDGSNTTSISLGDGITFSGTSNEVEVSNSGGVITIGLPNDVTIAGNLTVSGTTTTLDVDTMVVEDPLIKLAKGNGSDIVDIGFYGVYDTSSYAGLARDATDGKFYLFSDLSSEPTDNTIDGASSNVATLVASISGGTF